MLPKVVGFDDSLDRIRDAKWYWIVVAVAFCVAQFVAYVAAVPGRAGRAARDSDAAPAPGHASASYQITMAGLAATRIFSAAGAGGIVLTYWALRKAGMKRRRAAWRMLAFLVSSTRCTWWRWCCSACCCAPVSCPANRPSGARSCPPASPAE